MDGAKKLNCFPLEICFYDKIISQVIVMVALMWQIFFEMALLYRGDTFLCLIRRSYFVSVITCVVVASPCVSVCLPADILFILHLVINFRKTETHKSISYGNTRFALILILEEITSNSFYSCSIMRCLVTPIKPSSSLQGGGLVVPWLWRLTEVLSHSFLSPPMGKNTPNLFFFHTFTVVRDDPMALKQHLLLPLVLSVAIGTLPALKNKFDIPSESKIHFEDCYILYGLFMNSRKQHIQTHFFIH